MSAAIQARSASNQDLLIFPCNGNALEALDCLGAAFRCIGFVDDTPAKQGARVGGLPVLGRAALLEHPQALVLAVPGGPASFRSRLQLIAGLDIDPRRLATVIHPSARISPLATIGRNVLIMAGVVVTSNAVIDDHVCVLPNTVIHHDAHIGEGCLIGSNVTVAGGVALGRNSYVGSGSSLKNGIEIGAGALVGLGSNVLHRVPPGATVAGNPARSLQQ
ncbi:NeuD/PglB/VioB family sugar acetyltransferase [Rivibacter subsaxonicus]|uniref:Sugar O-acyltransferase (Sialic acid O-acetyltransferase NeuD family) n=1 Tax=Rivibacter subsaxonicus TaxID=457575 RepID=A0A4V2FU66_9BURK|nr:NeuD/PglB/VioB family sugar acetyltransferase [Rivibacter subsaxonicus]RZU00796.1 sugar O-acyltransferase (sialic acid O-acetyltransferase NeuD family) [Rivibacter subsaxonicus]